jgi:hypothetical protein
MSDRPAPRRRPSRRRYAVRRVVALAIVVAVGFVVLRAVLGLFGGDDGVADADGSIAIGAPTDSVATSVADTDPRRRR